MKNLFTSLFRKNISKMRTSDQVESATSTQHQTPILDELTSENRPDYQTSGRIKRFINEDHLTRGRSDGYNTHSEHDLEFGLNALKSRFRMEVNAVEELLKGSILNKNKKLIDLGGMLPNIKDKLKADLASDNEWQEELKYQKMMSVEGEGWISQVLYDYEKGFRIGMMDYLNIKTFTTRGIL